jgi:chemotaxis protein CheX
MKTAANMVSCGIKGMERAIMTLSVRPWVPLISNPENLDASVQEVLEMMLGVSCERLPESEAVKIAPASESVTAVVGLGGVLRGAFMLKCGTQTAVRIAELMTGIRFQNVDATVKDGLGEVCHMLAGVWKGKVPDLSAHCGLSVPAIITGRDYNLHVQAPELQTQHTYSLGDSGFTVTVVCDGF